jgi:hypothetical protein
MQDLSGMRWWLSVGDQDIGYYPAVFDTRFTDACYVEMGGRVLDARAGGLQPSTRPRRWEAACRQAQAGASRRPS